MAEKTFNVIDIMHPTTPVSLQELCVTAVGLELWRSEIDEHRKSPTLGRFCVSLLDNKASITSLRTKLPELPSVIYDAIVEYVTRLGKSMTHYFREHRRTVMYSMKRFHIRSRLSEILKYFDDFVCDYDGNIDFVKTSERMMHCDSLDDVLKFIVACTYFLEDHVRRIWPSVQGNMELRSIDFYSNPLMYFWICYLTNQLYKIPTDGYDTVYENMLVNSIHKSHNTLAINCFWNRVPYENQMQMANYASGQSTECFVRSILAKLDDRQLVKFVNENGSDMMQALLEDHSHDERLIFQTWMYVKSLMNGSTFYDLVMNMLRTEAGYFSHIDHQMLENWLHQCRLIWNSAPHNLKRSAITDISTDLELIICQKDYMSSTFGASSEFLLFILSDFTSEEKQCFWRNCWKNLILNKNARDLQRIIEMCLGREDDINEFKENVIAESENLLLRCVSLLSSVNFNELDALINFGCPRSAETAKRLKRLTLRSSLISDIFDFHRQHILHWEEFNTFINNAYDSVELANDFKHQLVSSPNNLRVMSKCILKQVAYAEAVRKFIETFVSTEQILQQIKSSIIDRLKENASRRSFAIEYANSKPSFDQFLLWCLGSNERVTEFRQTYITAWLEMTYFD